MTISSAAIIYHNGKYLLQKRDKNKIMLNEGQKYDFFQISKINYLEIIPWDLAAINYHFLIKVKKKKNMYNSSVKN